MKKTFKERSNIANKRQSRGKVKSRRAPINGGIYPTIRANQLNLDQLRYRCLSPIAKFKPLGDVINNPLGDYIYKDNESNILAVAHLDSVQNYKHFERVKIGNDDIVLNCQLDDRLGAYIILDLLPQLGINVDVLLTEGEESMQSTAQYFIPPNGKEYNWIISFDRAGLDVVCYQYLNDHISDMLLNYGIHASYGSYSDIVELDRLGCRGFNWGIGYHENHGKFSHMVIDDTVRMVNSFLAFYTDYKDIRFEYAYNPIGYWGGDAYDYSNKGYLSSYKGYNENKNTVWIKDIPYNQDSIIGMHCEYCDTPIDKNGGYNNNYQALCGICLAYENGGDTLCENCHYFESKYKIIDNGYELKICGYCYEDITGHEPQ